MASKGIRDEEIAEAAAAMAAAQAAVAAVEIQLKELESSLVWMAWWKALELRPGDLVALAARIKRPRTQVACGCALPARKSFGLENWRPTFHHCG